MHAGFVLRCALNKKISPLCESEKVDFMARLRFFFTRVQETLCEAKELNIYMEITTLAASLMRK